MAPRWGIFAAGKISSDFANALTAIGAPITAVAASDAARAKAFAATFSIPKFYGSYEALAADPDVDIVYIGTLHPAHKAQTLLCLEHGKHVLVEKPMALSAADAEEMVAHDQTTTQRQQQLKYYWQQVAKAREKKLFLMEGMWTRFFPAVREARRLLAEGAIGDIVSCTADFGFRGVGLDIPRLFQKELGGGGLWDIGIYPLAHASLAFGGTTPPSSVKAAGVVDKSGVDLAGSLVLTFGDQGLAQVHYTFLALTTEESVILGTKGELRILTPAHAPTRLKISLGQFTAPAEKGVGSVETREFPLPDVAPGLPALYFPNSQGFQYEAQAVIDCLAKGLTECPEYTLDESVVLARVTETALLQMGAIGAPPKGTPFVCQ